MPKEQIIWKNYVVVITKAMMNFRDKCGLSMEEAIKIVANYREDICENITEFLVDTISEVDADRSSFDETIKRLEMCNRADDFVIYMNEC